MMLLSFMSFRSLLLAGCIASLFSACVEKRVQPIFELLDSQFTGIDFVNTLHESPQLNIINYPYFYNGGGVAAGDLNGDGLPDLYFTSNQESNKLFLNLGNFKFKEVTDAAGVAGLNGWTTGVTMADVNGDGRLDIYISMVGDFLHLRGRNQLYINIGNDDQGTPMFEEQAKLWNLDFVGFSTQAAFFDFDLDGDLDVYLLNHSVHSNGTFGRSTIRDEIHPLAGDRLLRNDGKFFTDVTKESGIYSSALGYGLGISIGDINWDGYPDIYVGNDFHEDDYLYINNGDGTFTESLGESIRYTSRFSMGNDIGDINNDGLNDILSSDMLPVDPYMLKTAGGEDSYDVYNMKLGYGYKDQFVRNTLQLNIGNGRFSEIGMLSGIHATDWSWSALLADFDLDGHNDIYITNGIKRRANDSDYINYISSEAIQNRLEGDLTDQDLQLIEKMPVVKIPNYAFKNKGNLKFEDVSKSWGLGNESFSNGAAYVDLDNDGDLDIVVNNMDQPAFVYRSNATNGNNKFVKLILKGDSANTYGIGAKIVIPTDSGRIVRELYTTRGYQSSVSPEIVIGLGKCSKIDTLIVIWPDHKFQTLHNVDVNQILKIEKKEAKNIYSFKNERKSPFFNSHDSIKIDFKHIENRSFVEFSREGLIPHMASTEGPKIAIGDVNGDGLQDLFIGGAKHQTGALILQHNDGFETTYPQTFRNDSIQEDTDAVFFDVDNDGDLDLVVLSGGNEFRNDSENLLPRLYVNDGVGNFRRQSDAFAEIFVTGSCIRPFDFDNDGFIDLFIGGRVVPWKYGFPADSYLLKNVGKGKFIDVTKELIPELGSLGMVKDAAVGDFNNDGISDIVVVGEWMPVTFFVSGNGKWKKVVPKSLMKSNGWWNTIALTDIDNDGDIDIVAGNLGLNSKLKASIDKPVTAFINDFDDNGKSEPLIYYYQGDTEILFPTRDEVVKQIVSVKKKYQTSDDFARADPKLIVDKEKLMSAVKLTCNELRSGCFINNGNLNFSFKPFPIQAQVSPIYAINVVDFNEDKLPDLLMGGNYIDANIQRGKYNASYGALLRNEDNHDFKYVLNEQSGLYINGQIKDIKVIDFRGQKVFLFARNNDTIYSASISQSSK